MVHLILSIYGNGLIWKPSKKPTLTWVIFPDESLELWISLDFFCSSLFGSVLFSSFISGDDFCIFFGDEFGLALRKSLLVSFISKVESLLDISSVRIWFIKFCIGIVRKTVWFKLLWRAKWNSSVTSNSHFGCWHFNISKKILKIFLVSNFMGKIYSKPVFRVIIISLDSEWLWDTAVKILKYSHFMTVPCLLGFNEKINQYLSLVTIKRCSFS